MNSTTAPVFVDSNILVYTIDRRDERKHQTARSKVSSLWSSQSGTLSTQVLQEFYRTVTEKLPVPMTRQEARQQVSRYSKWSVVTLEPSVILKASSLQDRYGFSFWDSLIVAAASKVGAGTILTEDLQDGQEVEGMRIINPFNDTDR